MTSYRYSKKNLKGWMTRSVNRQSYVVWQYLEFKILQQWRNANLIIPSSDPQHEEKSFTGKHVSWGDWEVRRFTCILINLFLPSNMQRTSCVLFLVIGCLLCMKLSTSYGRRVSEVPRKSIVRGLYTKSQLAETLNIKCTGKRHSWSVFVHLR